MPYVTFAERYAKKVGQAEGLEKAIEAILQVRYPESLPSLMALVRQVESSDDLEQIVRLATGSSLKDIRAAFEAAQPATQ